MARNLDRASKFHFPQVQSFSSLLIDRKYGKKDDKERLSAQEASEAI